MKQLSFLDKIKVVFDITKSDTAYLVIMLLLAFLSILFATTNRKNAKESKKTYGIIYIVAIICIIFKYHDSLSTMFDTMMDNLFIIFYFPNISVYIAAIITTNIIMWITMFSKKTKTLVKIINSIVFFLMHYILVLFLSIITNNNLNVFDSVELYTNTDIHSLVELSSNIFVIWIIYLTIYKILMYYFDSKKLKVKEEINIKEKEYTRKTVQQSVPSYVKLLDEPIIVKRDRNNSLPSNINVLETPLIVKRDNVNNDNVFTNDPQLTQNDYKIVLQILHEEKEKMKMSKEESLKIEKDNEEKLSQLMELYKVV